CFVDRPQQDSRGILRIDGTKRRIEFFKQFEITLLHSTMFAVIHPIERLGGLAEVAAIVASYGSHLNLHALRDLSDVVNDGFRFLGFPIDRLITVLPRLVSTRKKKAEHAGIPVAVPAGAHRLRDKIRRTSKVDI